MPIAREGLREMALATLVLGACGVGAAALVGPTLIAGSWAALPFAILWAWVIAFFRDPKRVRSFEPGDLCAPADGTVTEITELSDHEAFAEPAVRIGMFLSLFNVHINRSPCSGRVRAIKYKEGEYLDARHPESGERNESNTLLIDPTAPMPGPIVVRQVAGLVARRIICHAKVDDHLSIGARFGLIKFGSRTELIIPRRDGTEILVEVGDKVRAGLTLLARQPAERLSATSDQNPGRQVDVSPSAAQASQT